MNDGILKIGTEVDLSDLESGMERGASAVEGATQQMISSFGRLQAASQTATAGMLSNFTSWTGGAFTTAATEVKKVAEGIEEVGKKSEGAGFNMRYAFFGLKDMAEGRYRFALAELANELTRMGGSVLTFGLIAGAVAGVGFAAYELYNKLKEIEEQPHKIDQAFHDLNTTLLTSIDETESENAKLANTLARLNGKPENGLAVAIHDIYLESDKLNESLTKILKNFQEILKKNEVSRVDKILGVHGTDDIDEWFDKYQSAVRAVNYAGNQNVHRPGLSKDDIEDAQKEWNRALDEMRESAQKKLGGWLGDAQKSHTISYNQAGGGFVDKQEDPANWDARVATLQDLVQELTSTGDLIAAKDANAGLKVAVDKAEIAAKANRQEVERIGLAERALENQKKIELLRIQMLEDVAKQKRRLEQTSNDQETLALLAAENERYNIELKAAEKLNALKAKAAALEHKPYEAAVDTKVLGMEHEKRTADIGSQHDEAAKREADQQSEILARMVEEQQKAAKKDVDEAEKALQKIGNDQIKSQERVAAINEQSELAHASRVYEINKEQIQEDFEQKRISIQKKLALLKQQEEQEYKTQKAAAEGQYQKVVNDKGVDTPEAAQAKAKIEEIADQYAIAMQKIKRETEKVTISGKQVALKYMTDISGAFTAGFSSWLEGHKKLSAAMEQSFRQMADQFIINLIRMQAQRLIYDAINKTANEKEAIHAASLSAVHAFKSVMAAVPFPANVVLAPITAAAMFAGAISLATFDHGGLVPKTQMSLVHGGESIYTEKQTHRIETALGGGKAAPSYHFHQARGTSPNDVTASAATFRRMMRDGALG